MPEKQKKVSCLTDLMAEEMTEVKEMVEGGLEALGFTDKIE